MGVVVVVVVVVVAGCNQVQSDDTVLCICITVVDLLLCVICLLKAWLL